MNNNEFYRSTSDIGPTFSLALAMTVAALSPPQPFSKDPYLVSGKDSICPNYAYYQSAQSAQSAEYVFIELSPLETIQQFEQNLAAVTEDNPQEIVQLLNKHFWELV